MGYFTATSQDTNTSANDMPASNDALVSVDTGHPLDDVASVHVGVLESDSIADAHIGLLGGGDGGGLLGAGDGGGDCGCGDSYSADSSNAIAVHADAPADLGLVSLDHGGGDALSVDVHLDSLPSTDAVPGDCLIGHLPDLCGVVGDIT